MSQIVNKKSVLEMAMGAIAEITDYEVERVVANIMDPNTAAKAKRKITITLTFTPDDYRQQISMDAQAKTSLVPVQPVRTNLCITKGRDGELLLAEMNQALQLHKKGTGIAISIPLNGMQGWLYKLINNADSEQTETELENEVKKMNDTITHAMILVTINHGYSDSVMCTARAAGATGGTILKGLRCSPTEVSTHFGIPLQDEQEIVAIVVPKDKKTDIMTAISSQHGIDTPAHAVAFSLPVDAIMGL